MNKQEIKQKISKLNSEIYNLYQTYTDITDPNCWNRVKEIDKEKKQLRKMLREIKQ